MEDAGKKYCIIDSVQLFFLIYICSANSGNIANIGRRRNEQRRSHRKRRVDGGAQYGQGVVDHENLCRWFVESPVQK